MNPLVPCLATITTLAALIAPTSVLAQKAGDIIPDSYIIKLNPNAVVNDTVTDIETFHGGQVSHVYKHAFHGFAARIPPARLKQLQQDSRIIAIYPDRVITLDAVNSTPINTTAVQIIPTGIRRINGPLSSTNAGNGSGTVNVNVAVIDTGIAAHSDLTVAGGYNCSSGWPTAFTDGNGHGTHVAGTIGAKDNSLGVVGVAPGARLWAVRVLNNAGSGSTSTVVCGINWVTANSSTKNIRVANMSLGGTGTDAGGCSGDPMHQAICNAVSAGVTFVVAAGNEADNAANHTPAAYNEVITVSALADFDGVAGGLGAPTCRVDEDDTLANFSNFGPDIDVIAPGVCIQSTWIGNAYKTISGTSMAAPHVAGAAALYLASHPGASPAVVKTAILGAGSNSWNAATDPDGIKEPLLDVDTF